MARTQYTFTFTNAQPGSVVSFDNIDADHLYAAAAGADRLGHPLVLDSSNSLAVWSDATQLTATTEDGAGNNISATATVANPSVTSTDGTAGQNPFGTGGSSAVVRKFPFTFSTAGLVTGHTVYTPTAGDVLLDAWFQIDLAWDGTDAQADFGTFTSGGDPDPQGMFAQTFRGPVDIGGGLNGNPNRGTRDKAFQDDALLLGQSLSSLRDVGMFDQIINVLKAPPVAETPQDAAQFVLYDGNSPYSPVLPDTHGDRILPAVFTGTPIKVCVSQDGTNTGADPGATQGAGALYLVTATPV